MFAMTFFIVLFIVLMQFLWRYMDDLIGKGLAPSVLGELFFYAAVSMVPMALPLAILLASLMTFGNLGEKSELTAIKASGVSLIKTMSPLIVLVGAIAVGAFFFQNDVLPRAQVKMWTLLFSARQKSPELEIPEGSFYDQIPGYNLYVKSKNRDTGMLYGAMIYQVSSGQSGTILLADSARLAFTPDMRFLYLHLYQGEQFEDLKNGNDLSFSSNTRNIPFRREKFLEKEILVPFDANFNRLDEQGMRSQYVGKNIAELHVAIDSIHQIVDSLGDRSASGFFERTYPHLSGSASGAGGKRDNKADKKALPAPMSIDSLLLAMTPSQQNRIFSSASQIQNMRVTDMEFRAQQLRDEKVRERRNRIELIKKYTLSVACIIFLFIGAPLGAIIRKGGLGTPMVISVILFLIYYIIDNTGFKMAREGIWPVWTGIWLSTFILLPLGIFVTYKAMNDSSVFTPDLYREWLRRRLGIPQTRLVTKKEVIITEVDPVVGEEMRSRLQRLAAAWLARYGHFSSYRDYWLRPVRRSPVERISAAAEQYVAYMSDSRDLKVIDSLNRVPVITWLWIYAPVRSLKVRKILYWFVPAGGILWLLSMPYLRRLRRDMLQITDNN